MNDRAHILYKRLTRGMGAQERSNFDAFVAGALIAHVETPVAEAVLGRAAEFCSRTAVTR